MNTVGTLVKRNVKLFFKDKGTFFTSLITPVILLVLYVTFLYNVYEDTFRQAIAAASEGMRIGGKPLRGLVGGLLLSSLLSVSSVTVPFCANLTMVADKVSGARGDLSVSPVKPREMALGYYLSTVINGLIINGVAATIGFIYLACVGWYLSVADVACLLLDVVLLTLFGTALSSLICYPLTTQGQLSAVGSIVSSGYGFICGAYMPMSQFPSFLRGILSFFPGTYGTSLTRRHALGGVLESLKKEGVPYEGIEGIKEVADYNLQFFGNGVEGWQCYLAIGFAIALLLGGYILLNVLSTKRKTK